VAGSEQKQGVGYTAFFVATVRALETGHERPLFHDPYARLFMRDDVGVAMRSLPFFTSIARCRTVWFDDAVRRALDAGRSQVVILGAGFDSRALRLARPGASFFEIDQQQVLEIKEERLRAAGLERSASYLGADYTQPGIVESLTACGFDSRRPTLVLWEGNTYYLPPARLRQVLRTFLAAAPDLVVAFDWLGTATIEGRGASPELNRSSAMVREIGAPWVCAIDDRAALGAEVGLHVIEDLTFGALHARLLPDEDLGASAGVDHGFCLFASDAAARTHERDGLSRINSEEPSRRTCTS
jgi:methyltransferase (TIGR00027 family)